MTMQAPIGKVTLAFTDVQESTRLWDQDSEAMESALALHDSVMRQCISEVGGYEVKTEGDAFMVAFHDASTAVRWSVMVQERLLGAAWPESILRHGEAALESANDGKIMFCGLRVRMGLHTGEPLCRPDPLTSRMDYFGGMVNRSARIAAIAHGGQILLSDATFASASNASEIGRVIDHGEHALKGLEQREHLREIQPRTLFSRTFPSLVTPSLNRTNLPSRVDTFFGRKEEIDSLEERISSGSRLISLIGPGGSGKSRLGQHVGARALANFPGGVWFCDLSEVRTRTGVLNAIGSSMSVRLNQQDAETQLADAVRSRRKILIILDSIEQCISEVAPVIARLLTHAPEAVVISTSRTLMRIRGEESMILDPLPSQTAVDLFFDRAQAVDSTFERTPERETVVAKIVERLDGLCLAIELAAVRVRMMSVTTILSRLSERFALLRSNRRDQTERQMTLQGAIEWSWQILKPYERSALVQLSAFAGGFSLDAAESVIELIPDDNAPTAVDIVGSLVDQSLLRLYAGNESQVRYRLLESIREFAAMREPALLDGVAMRHARFFAAFGQPRYLDSLTRGNDTGRLKTLMLELDNLLVATNEALAAGNNDIAAACALATAPIFLATGPMADGIATLERVLEKDLSTEKEALIQLDRGRLLYVNGRGEEACEAFDKANHLAQQLGDASLQARILANRAVVLADQGQFAAAIAMTERAVTLAVRAGDDHTHAVILGNRAILHHRQGELENALHYYERSLAMHRKLRNRRIEGGVLGNMAALQIHLGRISQAQVCHQQALEIHREVGERRGEGLVLGNLADLLQTQGKTEAAIVHYNEAIVICDEVYPWAAGKFRGSLGLIAAQSGSIGQARQLFDSGVNQLRGVHAVELGIFLAKWARAERLADNQTRAKELLDEAEALAKKLGVNEQSELSQIIKAAHAEKPSASQPPHTDGSWDEPVIDITQTIRDFPPFNALDLEDDQ